MENGKAYILMERSHNREGDEVLITTEGFKEYFARENRDVIVIYTKNGLTRNEDKIRITTDRSLLNPIIIFVSHGDNAIINCYNNQDIVRNLNIISKISNRKNINLMVVSCFSDNPIINMTQTIKNKKELKQQIIAEKFLQNPNIFLNSLQQFNKSHCKKTKVIIKELSKFWKGNCSQVPLLDIKKGFDFYKNELERMLQELKSNTEPKSGNELKKINKKIDRITREKSFLEGENMEEIRKILDKIKKRTEKEEYLQEYTHMENKPEYALYKTKIATYQEARQRFFQQRNQLLRKIIKAEEKVKILEKELKEATKIQQMIEKRRNEVVNYQMDPTGGAIDIIELELGINTMKHNIETIKQSSDSDKKN